MNEQSAPDPASVEVLRAWVVGETLHCSLAATVPDAETWGLVLADVARHVAEAFQEQQGAAPEATLERIRAAFEEGVRAPAGTGTEDA
jgi:hypothetical protein